MGSSRFLVAGSLVLAALALSTGARAAAPRSSPYPEPKQCRAEVPREVVTKGKLTVATNDPALWPWFVDNKPSNHKGYESEVAYQIAAALGIKASDVVWVDVPYEVAVAPGAKDFDFDVNEIIYKKSLTKDVAMSSWYFNVNESLVAMKGSAIVTHHTPKQLHKDVFGALAKSPALAYLTGTLKPKTAPVSYANVAAAVAGLQDHQVDALVFDTPTAHYLVTEQMKSAVQFAQFRTTGTYYAAALQKGNPLALCVDVALQVMKREHKLAKDSKDDLSVYNSIPFIQP